MNALVHDLAQAGLLTADQANVILHEGAQNQLCREDSQAFIKNRPALRSIEQLCLASGFVTHDQLCAFFEEKGRFPFTHLTGHHITHTTACQLPKDVSAELCAIVFDVTPNQISVAMKEPHNIEARDRLQAFWPNKVVRFFQSTESEIRGALASVWAEGDDWQSVLGDLNALASATFKALADAFDSSSVTQESSAPVVDFIQRLLLASVQSGFSDIHFHPGPFCVSVRVRQDGVLRPLCVFHKGVWPHICVRIKVLAGLDIAESRRPQQGRFSDNIATREVDIRVALHPTLEGEACVLRVLDKSKTWRQLDSLGLPDALITQLQACMSSTQGLLVVTGPTGSGKTTTLHALLGTINRERLNIITLEEPVEYRASDLRQSEVNEALGFDFADGIASALRQDVDVLLIGEIRSPDAARMAMRAAMTGHLVLTTMHTPHAMAAIDRLLEFGVPAHQISGYVCGVFAQRLVRRTCARCAGLQATRPSPPIAASDCVQCVGTGFYGRQAIGEYIDAHTICEKVRLGAQKRAYNADNSMCGLWNAGHILLSQGVTSLQELVRVLGPEPCDHAHERRRRICVG